MPASALATDLYQLTMMAGYFASGRHRTTKATFELFVRRLPPNRQFLIAVGTPVFAYEPLLQITAPIPEALVVETGVLAFLTFLTSVASKAARVVIAAAGRPVMEFGARRAHGLDAALFAARAAFIAGCAGTS